MEIVKEYILTIGQFEEGEKINDKKLCAPSMYPN
jgi:hypothetical protein